MNVLIHDNVVKIIEMPLSMETFIDNQQKGEQA